MYINNNDKFKEGIVWWDQKPDKNKDVDVFFYIHDYEGRAENKYGFKTLTHDLKQSESSLMDGYNNNIKRSIKSAKEIKLSFHFELNPSEEFIDFYVENFNSFANYKKIGTTTKEMISQMVNDKKLVVTLIKDVNGNIINVHSHYSDGKTARLYHSFSLMNDLSPKESGWANKYLTHLDLMFFKEQKHSIYDMGGIGNVEGDNSRFEGIINFKKQFGGKETILWKGVTANGQRGIEVINKYFNS